MRHRITFHRFIHDAYELTSSVDPSSASLTLAKLQGPAKQSLDKLKNTLKDIHEGYGKYQKAIDKVRVSPGWFIRSIRSDCIV